MIPPADPHEALSAFRGLLYGAQVMEGYTDPDFMGMGEARLWSTRSTEGGTTDAEKEPKKDAVLPDLLAQLGYSEEGTLQVVIVEDSDILALKVLWHDVTGEITAYVRQSSPDRDEAILRRKLQELETDHLAKMGYR